jgi:hypothetical protein
LGEQGKRVVLNRKVVWCREKGVSQRKRCVAEKKVCRREEKGKSAVYVSGRKQVTANPGKTSQPGDADWNLPDLAAVKLRSSKTTERYSYALQMLGAKRRLKKMKSTV